MVAVLAVAAVVTFRYWAPYFTDVPSQGPGSEVSVEQVSSESRSSGEETNPALNSGQTTLDKDLPIQESGNGHTVTEAVREEEPDPLIAGPEIRSIDSSTEAVPTVAAPAAVDSFIIHVASFQDKERARHFRNRLANDGWNSFVQVFSVANGRTWNRVYLGPFAGRKSASLAVEELTSGGVINYYKIIRR